MNRIMVLGCLLLVACGESHIEQQGIMSVPRGTVPATVPAWLWILSAVALVALVAGVVFFLRDNQDNDSLR